MANCLVCRWKLYFADKVLFLLLGVDHWKAGDSCEITVFWIAIGRNQALAHRIGRVFGSGFAHEGTRVLVRDLRMTPAPCSRRRAALHGWKAPLFPAHDTLSACVVMT